MASSEHVINQQLAAEQSSESSAAGRGAGVANRFPIRMKFYYDRKEELSRLSKAEIEKIQAEVDAGNPNNQSETAQKQWEIAQCFEYGYQVPINDNESIRYRELAAKNRHPEALCVISRFLCSGYRGIDLPPPEDPKVKTVAFLYAKESLALGYEGALYVLAKCYLKNYIPPEENQSKRLLMAYQYVKEDFDTVYEHLPVDNKENRIKQLQELTEALRAQSVFADPLLNNEQRAICLHLAEECEKIYKEKEPAFLRLQVQQLKQELKEQTAKMAAQAKFSLSSSSSLPFSSSSSLLSSSVAAGGAAAAAAASVPMSDSDEMPESERKGFRIPQPLGRGEQATENSQVLGLKFYAYKLETLKKSSLFENMKRGIFDELTGLEEALRKLSKDPKLTDGERAKYERLADETKDEYLRRVLIAGDVEDQRGRERFERRFQRIRKEKRDDPQSLQKPQRVQREKTRLEREQQELEDCLRSIRDQEEKANQQNGADANVVSANTVSAAVDSLLSPLSSSSSSSSSVACVSSAAPSELLFSQPHLSSAAPKQEGVELLRDDQAVEPDAAAGDGSEKPAKRQKQKN